MDRSGYYGGCGPLQGSGAGGLADPVKSNYELKQRVAGDGSAGVVSTFGYRLG